MTTKKASSKKTTKKAPPKKTKKTYPQITYSLIRHIEVKVAPALQWYVGDDTQEDTGKPTGRVLITAPCGQDVSVSKKEYIALREACDRVFGLTDTSK